jgi:excisionase family DNA binding protein
MTETNLKTTAQAAGRLGCSIRTILRMVEDGRLTPAAKMPGESGGYLFESAEVERAATERAVELTAELQRLNATPQ